MSTISTESAGESHDEGLTDTSLPSLRTNIGRIIFLIGFVLAIGNIYFLWQRPVVQTRYVNLHLLGAFVVFFLLEVYEDRSASEWSRRKWAVIVGFGLATFAGVLGTTYIQFMHDVLSYERYGAYTQFDLIAGALIVLAVLVATQRAYGWIITLVGVFALLFAKFGNYFPGLLNHGGLSNTRIIEIATLNFTGVYQMIFQIGATWVFVFVIWAGIVEEFGGLDSFMDIGFLVGRRFKSGIAQTAVVSSMIMGSISGSPMANIVVTGSFTIPLMKERGIEADTAASIETVASTGGMILPPIMGSVAFLMVSFLGITYGHVIIAAALPAILFYTAVALSVHILVLKSDIDLTVTRDVERRNVLWNFVPVLVSILVLVYLLIGIQLGPGISGVYTIAVLVGTIFLRDMVTGESKAVALKEFLWTLTRGLVKGTVRMVPLSMALAVMGLIISTFNITGIGYRIALSIVDVSGGNLVILLALVMVSSIIMGMGMPTPAAYLLTVTLVAPAMTQVGFEAITAHFFVFYFAMLAAITPPIALGAAVAARVADAEFLDVALKSMKLAIPLFLLPYVFAANESLLLLSGMDTVVAFVATFFGFLFLTLALHGGIDFLRGKGRYLKRTAMGTFGVAIVFAPGLLF
ncbi:MAG: TRAP transporter permease [Halobacteriota archaeon]